MAPSPCPQNTYGDSGKLSSETQCTPCAPGKESGSGAVACSSPCIPSPWNVQTFQCYSTEGKVVVVLTWCASLFSAVFFPFKVWGMYKHRRGKLAAKGVQPTLKHLIFYRTALSRAVSLQPLIGSRGGDDGESKPPPEWSRAPSAAGDAAACEAAQGATFHQTSQIDAVLRINADLQQKLLEQEQRVKEQEQKTKDQEQGMKEQERAMALLQQQVASSPRPRSQCDDV